MISIQVLKYGNVAISGIPNHRPLIGAISSTPTIKVPTEIVGTSYAREIGGIPSAMGNGLLTTEKWAKVSTIKGNSVVDGEQIISYQQWGESMVWNQLNPNYNFENDATSYDLINVSTSNNIVNVSGASIHTGYVYSSLQKIKIQQGHKYLVSVDVKPNESITTSIQIFNFNKAHTLVQIQKFAVVNNIWQTLSYIGTANASGNGTLLVYPAHDKSLYNTLTSWQGTNFCAYDLTLMFGEGNEPTTVEEFERRRPRNVTNEYNEGTEINGDIEIKSVGLNQWDEEWEEGTVNSATGANAASNLSLRSKNFISVIGGGKYKYVAAYSSVTTRYAIIFTYDNNKQFIRSLSNIKNGSTVTMPTDACYCKITHKYYIQDYGTYNNDICLHLVQDGIVSQYKPYTSTTTPLPNVTLIKDADGNQLFPYGLCSAGSVYDEITETKAIKRVGVVDMGTLDWTYVVNSQISGTSFRCQIADRKNDRDSITNVLCGIYSTVDNSVMENTSFTGPALLGNSGLFGPVGNISIVVKDPSYTDATTFKQAMSGVLLYYELAEPIEVEIDKWKAEYKVEQGGTEQIVSANDTTNLKTDIIYGNKV